MPPLISIIIPVRDEEKVIGTSLAQFQKLTIAHELIVSDGGSSDKTIEIARKYTSKIAVWEEKNRRQTIPAGRNAGARLASGKYIAYLDADCSIRDPNAFFGTLVQKFEADSQLGAVVVNVRTEPSMASWADKLVYWYMNTYVWFCNNIIHLGGGFEFYMFSKPWFDKIGGFHEDLAAAEDFDIFMRMAKVAKTRSITSLTIFHTNRHSQKTGWPKLLWKWFLNFASLVTRGKSYSHVWTEVR